MIVGEFEWDDAKAEGNLAKHGVTLMAARSVFTDGFALERSESGISSTAG
jgi:uncharacterized DUF497 family protein